MKEKRAQNQMSYLHDACVLASNNLEHSTRDTCTTISMHLPLYLDTRSTHTLHLTLITMTHHHVLAAVDRNRPLLVDRLEDGFSPHSHLYPEVY